MKCCIKYPEYVKQSDANTVSYNSIELVNNNQNCSKNSSFGNNSNSASTSMYHFDKVFTESSSQEDVRIVF